MIIGLLIFIIMILLLFCISLTIKNNHKIEVDKKAIEENNKLKIMQAELENNVKQLNIDNNRLKYENNELDDIIHKKRNNLNDIIEQNKEISDLAFQEYVKNLDNKYNQIEEEFDYKIDTLREQLSETTMELDKMKQTRAAAHEALLKEQEVKENKDNYRLLPSDSDLADARRLEIVKRELNKPRILSMLVWQTYWQPIAKKQFPQILQAKTRCGIYKITNIITDECYIGQSNDIYRRWSDHCKCGLGIDTPQGNKLYKAIQEYGLENFTFELIEECSQKDLNEKEKYFIELYQADTFGYNGTKGNLN